MITNSMQLHSMSDARTWAFNNGNFTDNQASNLADWIWENKPEIGCRYDEHPLYSIGDGLFEIIGDE